LRWRNPLGGTFPEYLLICKVLIYKGIPCAGLIDGVRIGPDSGLLDDLNMSGVHVMGWLSKRRAQKNRIKSGFLGYLLRFK